MLKPDHSPLDAQASFEKSTAILSHKEGLSKKQRGFSAWTLLPWLLFLTLAFVFWWFVNERTQGMSQPVTPEQVVPAVIAPTEPVAPVVSSTPVVSYHDAVSKASVSVVNIYTTQKVENPYAGDPVLRQLLEYHGFDLPQADDETNLGSGVVVSADGYIITNAHVIDKADEIIVALSDGRKATAEVIGSDVETDLAVIKVALSDLTPLAFKKSPVQVGDVTLAIGNPFGVGQTVTQGIVSATGRTGLGVSTFEDFIQTDAAINPGNSGGALVDAYGELIGINTMIYSRSGGSMGIGFAIPTALVEKVMQDLIATGTVSRGWLGIEVGRRPNNPASLENQTGVLVANVTPDGPAATAGVMAGDVILAIDGTPIVDANALVQGIAKKAPNSTVKIELERAGEKLSLDATLAQRPDFSGRSTQLPQPQSLPIPEKQNN
ncbi:MAG: trypsin-like peptidase domain-containing protein [Moraxella sp.]|nr:trypsin-like peptidase domain-containing protein [Moraxella sp.]